jgi:hypothetical protein
VVDPYLDPEISAVGIISSDACRKIKPEIREQLTIVDTGWRVPNLRTALLTRQGSAASLQAKIAAEELIVVGTSSPEQLPTINKRNNLNLQLGAVYAGQIEKLLKVLPGLDGAVDLVLTGDSYRRQDLEVAIDNLDFVTLCAIWAIERRRNV